MITNRILNIKVVNGTPLIPGDVYITKEISGYYIVYSNQITKVKNHKGTHLPVAFVNILSINGDNAICAVFANKDVIDTIDPSGKGLAMTSYKLDAEKIKNWPIWYCIGTYPDPDDQQKISQFRGILRAPTPVKSLPWTIENVTVTQSKPAVPSSVGSVDMLDSLDNANPESEII